MDGWDASRQTVYEYNACYWHGHSCQATNYKTFNTTVQKSFWDLPKETKENEDYLTKELGLKLVSIKECEWLSLRKKPEIQTLLAEHCPQTQSAFSLSDERRGITLKHITRAILEGELFGLVLCSLHIPDILKEKFSEFQPIFKSVEVTFKDLSPPHARLLRRTRSHEAA